jgi:hypothetical protein
MIKNEARIGKEFRRISLCPIIGYVIQLTARRPTHKCEILTLPIGRAWEVIVPRAVAETQLTKAAASGRPVRDGNLNG